jgi:hypothetical protein
MSSPSRSLVHPQQSKLMKILFIDRQAGRQAGTRIMQEWMNEWIIIYYSLFIIIVIFFFFFFHIQVLILWLVWLGLILAFFYYKFTFDHQDYKLLCYYKFLAYTWVSLFFFFKFLK